VVFIIVQTLAGIDTVVFFKYAYSDVQVWFESVGSNYYLDIFGLIRRTVDP